MITFKTGMDARCRDAKQASTAQFAMGDGTYQYCVIGTEYGYIHTSGGAVRVWKSRGGADKFAQSYRNLMGIISRDRNVDVMQKSTR